MSETDSKKVVICVAPNGARHGKSAHPRIPLTTSELASEALACMSAGATVMHLHVRDSAGVHSLDADLYREALAAIESAVGARMIVQITTEAVGRFGPAQQMQVVRQVRPDCASVAVRELIPDEASEPPAAEFFGWALTAGVGLQYIIYSVEDARRLISLQRAGVIPHKRPHTLFVLGRYTAHQHSDPLALLPILTEWPRDWPWSLCAFGRSELRCLAAGMALGGHPRVGFENNMLRPDGFPAADNAANVATVRDLIVSMGASPATLQDARALFVETE